MTFPKNIVRKYIVRLYRLVASDNKGIALLEAVISVTIFAALGTALMVGIRTSNVSGTVVEDQSIAEKLARNQMEYVFTQAYVPPPGSYTSIQDATDISYTVDPGFAISAEALVYTEGDPLIVDDSNIEKVVVTVSEAGEDILVIETLRTNN